MNLMMPAVKLHLRTTEALKQVDLSHGRGFVVRGQAGVADDVRKTDGGEPARRGGGRMHRVEP